MEDDADDDDDDGSGDDDDVRKNGMVYGLCFCFDFHCDCEIMWTDMNREE